ncbi:MAG: hypothetical protein ACREAA_06810 [Candidatus Polarisedimenticolia bacterium]
MTGSTGGRATRAAIGASLLLAAWLFAGGVRAGAQQPPAGEAGPLTLERVVEMLRAGKTSDQILPLIEPSGARLQLTVDDVILLRKIGASVELIRAMSRSDAAPAEPSTGSPAPGAKPAAGSLTVRDVLRELGKGTDPAVVQQRIAAEGLKKPVEIHEIAQLSAMGVQPDVLRALARGQVKVEEAPAPAEAPTASELVAIPAPPSADTPTGDEANRLWIASVPTAARVYLASGRSRPEDLLEHAQYAGRTPLSLSLEPGDYVVVVEKEAGAFEEGLIPAWRTAHDTASSRSVLDDAELSFDPAACCLPGSLGGRALLRPLPRDVGRTLIGDAFDGLPPWLFDGEVLQVLRIRQTRITQSLKMYRLRKNAGKPRMLVSLFVPAEGDPLDQALAGLPAGTPYDAWVDAPGLESLRDPGQLADLSAALKVDRPHLEEAVAMLRRAGKAIMHQQVDGGLRLVSLAVEDRGLMRLSESTLIPTDPFAPPEPPPKKKKRVKPLPAPPPLPEAARVVVPGLGAPRVTLHNSSSHGLGILLDDGLFVWLAPGAQREAAVDPGTYDVRVLTAGASPEAPAPSGRLHLSYDARYTLTF